MKKAREHETTLHGNHISPLPLQHLTSMQARTWVRGMGVAVMCSTCGAGEALASSRPRCSTPNLNGVEGGADALLNKGFPDGMQAREHAVQPPGLPQQTGITPQPPTQHAPQGPPHTACAYLCCSSTTASPSRLNWVESLIRAWVPTAMSLHRKRQVG